MKNPKNVKILAENIVYRGFLQVKKIDLQYELFEGGMSEKVHRELLVKPWVAAVLPYDPYLDSVVLIEQFRVGALASENPWLYEIVAGIADTNELPLQLAYRETQEETGLTIQELIPICEYWVSPGASNELVHLFCGKVDASNAGGVYGNKAEHEDIRVIRLPAEQAFEYVRSGKIANSASLIALQWLELHRNTLIGKWRT